MPLPLTLLPMQVVVFSSSNFTMVCPRLERVCITTDIPADDVHNGLLRRITKFVETRHDAGFTLSSPDVNISVVMPISDQVRADYTMAWDALVGVVASSVRF